MITSIDRQRLDQSAPRFAGLLSGAQHLESGDDDSKQAVGILPRSNSPLGLSLGYSAANTRIYGLSSLVNGHVFIFTSTT